MVLEKKVFICLPTREDCYSKDLKIFSSHFNVAMDVALVMQHSPSFERHRERKSRRDSRESAQKKKIHFFFLLLLLLLKTKVDLKEIIKQ